MKIFTFIKSLFQKKHFTGVLPDPRTTVEKERDFKHEERIVAGGPVYGAKMLETPYPVENQNYTSSCVPHAVKLALAIEMAQNGGNFVRTSAMMPYRLRGNFPQEGSYPPQIFEYLRTIGSCLYDTLPTPMTEAEANALSITPAMFMEGAKYKGYEYYTFTTPNDFDKIVTAVSEGRAVPITFYSSLREWGQKYPKIMDDVSVGTAQVRHEVCILPNSAFIEDGVKYVVVQDSAHFGEEYLRYVSEEFIRARVYGAGYWLKPKVEPPPKKPKATFSVPLIQGMVGEKVKDLQKILNYEGFLPNDCITGYYGPRTRAAVKKFQEKYKEKILTPLGLKEGTGAVYQATIKVLNELYS